VSLAPKLLIDTSVAGQANFFQASSIVPHSNRHQYGSIPANAEERNAEALDSIERRVLEGGFAEPQRIPTWMDERLYVRIPAYPIYILKNQAVVRYYTISASFILLALVSRQGRHWPVSITWPLDYVATYWFALLMELAAEEILRLHVYYGSVFARLVSNYVLSNIVLFIVSINPLRTCIVCCSSTIDIVCFSGSFRRSSYILANPCNWERPV
jgi:hypothetical protein